MTRLSLFLAAFFWCLMACNTAASKPEKDSGSTTEISNVSEGMAKKDSVPECCQSNIPSRFAPGKKMDSAMNKLTAP